MERYRAVAREIYRFLGGEDDSVIAQGIGMLTADDNSDAKQSHQADIDSDI